MTTIVALFVLATFFVVAEVLFPSFGLLSLLALGCYAAAVIEAFEIGRTEGISAVVAVIVVVPAAIALGFQLLQRTRLGSRLLLSGPRAEDVHAGGADRGLARFRDATGVTAGPLRPSGVVLFGEDRVDAVSDGRFIAAGTPVRVIEIEGNRLVVEATGDGNDAPPGAHS
ncbi:MAG: NfeD family protein [Planctomycetota bacterium]